ncbi:DUF4349 domain-containing protein [Microbacterium halophytorum]|uniref:DUF4349 domain-containing protein n=1 Tax=Microbacterium halophytorum TaxID=2067568 RepID=UPI000CFBD299|nr:DUF4349 domain-containing protein [Microbacterium halophytorum]
MSAHENGAGEQELPELPDEAVERIERGVFAQIARERGEKQRQARARRRRWTRAGYGLAAAGIVAVVAVPFAVSSLGGGADDAAAPESAPYDQAATEEVDGDAGGSGADDGAMVEDAQASDEAGAESDSSAAVGEDAGDRMVIRNAYANLLVDDVRAAGKGLTELAEEHDGYVQELGESSQEGVDGADPTEVVSGWATLRIPADDLDGVRAELAELGDVTSMQVSESDVTSQAIDLEARIDTARASVDRLTELMAKAGSVGDLLEAETALSERQAQLESYERELEHLDDQVAMSTLSVELRLRDAAEGADPAGFFDGLVAGWNGLVAFFDGVIVAVGWLIPWAAVVAVLALFVWAIVRLRRRRRAAD